MIELGIKTDCIETRYSFEWLFDLLVEEEIEFVQLGSFYELYWLEDSWFVDLRQQAESRGLRIKSVFTAHRELGGFFVGDPRWEAAARKGFEKLLHAAALVGADYAGSNPGAVWRDQAQEKEEGTLRYLSHLKELSALGKSLGLKGLTMEPMSCLAEPPSTPEEIRRYMEAMAEDHAARPDQTIPTYLCGDVSHAVCDAEGHVLHSCMDLFRAGGPHMAEFHFKNTDAKGGSTFGFGPGEKGIISLPDVKAICEEIPWPVDQVVGYLEIMGPKIGRDYSDPHLGQALRESLRAIKDVFRS